MAKKKVKYGAFGHPIYGKGFAKMYDNVPKKKGSESQESCCIPSRKRDIDKSIFAPFKHFIGIPLARQGRFIDLVA